MKQTVATLFSLVALLVTASSIVSVSKVSESRQPRAVTVVSDSPTPIEIAAPAETLVVPEPMRPEPPPKRRLVVVREDDRRDAVAHPAEALSAEQEVRVGLDFSE